MSYLIIAGQLVALLALGDKVKPEAKTFIAELQAQGITPVMLTGDNQTVPVQLLIIRNEGILRRALTRR